MKYTASRISDGNKLFPAEITIDEFSVTLKIPGFLSGKEKSMGFKEISSVSVDTPIVGYSTIYINTVGQDRIRATGFTKADVNAIKQKINDGKRGQSSAGSSGGGQFIASAAESDEVKLARIEQKNREIELEREREIKNDKENAEFVDGLKKYWKIWVPIVGLFVCFMIYQSFSDDTKSEELAAKCIALEQVEDKIKLAIAEGEKEKALGLSNELVMTEHEPYAAKSKGLSTVYYDEYWSEKREKYKAEIMTINVAADKPNQSIEQQASTPTNDTTIVMELKQEPTTNYFMIKDADGFSNLRDEPNGAVVRKVYATEKFEVIDSSGSHKKVRLADGTIGFIHSSRVIPFQ